LGAEEKVCSEAIQLILFLKRPADS